MRIVVKGNGKDPGVRVYSDFTNACLATFDQNRVIRVNLAGKIYPIDRRSFEKRSQEAKGSGSSQVVIAPLIDNELQIEVISQI